MKSKSYLIGLSVLIAVFGFINTVKAAPDESQRLRGLGDRVFLVEVEVVASFIPDFSVGDRFPQLLFLRG